MKKKSVSKTLPTLYKMSVFSLEREEEWQHENHDYAYDNLQRQTYLHIVGEGVVAGMHDECVRRCRERRCEAHAGAERHGEEHRHGVDAYFCGCAVGYRCHEHGCRCIAYEHCEERCREVYAGKKNHRADGSERFNERVADEF